jgi:hypothetical protein
MATSRTGAAMLKHTGNIEHFQEAHDAVEALVAWTDRVALQTATNRFW